MMDEDRFKRLEGKNSLPPAAKDAVPNLQRFERLEIGELRSEPAEVPPGESHFLCRHCGKGNERLRETCWACHKKLGEKERPARARGPMQPQDITLVLDGFTYRSTDKDLPDDVRELMVRINTSGYSEALLTEWRAWRARKRTGPPPPAPEPQEPPPLSDYQAPIPDLAPAAPANDNVKVFKGQRVSVIRIDDKVYTSDDKDLTPELKEFFRYIDEHGVTPALMDHLRAQGKNVKFRPSTTNSPSDGDVAFWKQVGAAPLSPKQTIERAEADLRKLQNERTNYDNIWRTALPISAGAGYILLRFFLG